MGDKYACEYVFSAKAIGNWILLRDTASMLISVSPRQPQDKAALNSSAVEFTLVDGIVFYVIRYRGLAEESLGEWMWLSEKADVDNDNADPFAPVTLGLEGFFSQSNQILRLHSAEWS